MPEVCVWKNLEAHTFASIFLFGVYRWCHPTSDNVNLASHLQTCEERKALEGACWLFAEKPWKWVDRERPAK